MCGRWGYASRCEGREKDERERERWREGREGER